MSGDMVNITTFPQICLQFTRWFLRKHVLWTDDWRNAYITPIFKKENRHEPVIIAQYRLPVCAANCWSILYATT